MSRHFLTRDRCPVCHSKHYTTLICESFKSHSLTEYLEQFYSGRLEFDYLEGAEYTLHECKHCAAIYQAQIPNEFLMKRLYEKWIDPNLAINKTKKDDDLKLHSFHAKEIMQIIGYFNKPSSKLNLFDFGMGWGHWALMAKAFGCQSYGTEISKDRIDNCVTNGIRVIHWDDIPNYQFDFINTEQVFEHIIDPLNTLVYLKEALAPKGLVKISVPNSIGIRRKLRIMDWQSPKGSRNSLNPVAPLEHINLFRRRSILEMASKANMKEVYIPLITQYKYTTIWSNIGQSAKNILLPIFLNYIRNLNYVFLQKQEI